MAVTVRLRADFDFDRAFPFFCALIRQVVPATRATAMAHGMRAPSRLVLVALLLLAGSVPSWPKAPRRSVEKERAMRAAEEQANRSYRRPKLPPQPPPPPPPPPCDRLHEDCPVEPGSPEPFAHERASQEQMKREDAVPKPKRDGDPERIRRDKSLSDGWRKLDDKIHGWRDGQFGEVEEP
jgi:hypothetical protein